jgi:hypothetical protein
MRIKPEDFRCAADLAKVIPKNPLNFMLADLLVTLTKGQLEPSSIFFENALPFPHSQVSQNLGSRDGGRF